MSAAPRIWASLDAFVEPGPVLGRRVANATFLQALLKADPYDGYHFFLKSNDDAEALAAWLAEAFPALAGRGAFWTGTRLALPGRLAAQNYHCMHLADPVSYVMPLTQLRNAYAANLFPITSLTHSLSYARFMPEYLKLVWPGVSPRDAVIVTSQAARLVMERVFAGLTREYGLDAEVFAGPHTALVPLGVDLADLPGPGEHWTEPGGQAGRQLRERLTSGDEPVFLCFARIDPYSKMDLVPLFAAFRRAEDLGLASKGYRLILAGWADEGDELPGALVRYAQSMGIRTEFFARPTLEERRALYAAADVFVSPSDNVQETFGLTVAEAGAAGLPVVASDFDGYRDIVAHNETGILIPTLGFACSAATDMAALYMYDNQYHLPLVEQTVVSVPDMAVALAGLGADKALRRRMGETARARVRRLFSWDAVMARMVALWDQLAAKPLSLDDEQRLRKARHPQLMRFAEYFRGHFTAVADEAFLHNVRLRRTPLGEAVYRKTLPVLQYAGMDLLLDMDAVRRLLLAARKPVLAGDLLRVMREHLAAKGPLPDDAAGEMAAFTLLWALKHDFLERTPA